MDTVLCIVCILALCFLVYYLTMGYNRTKQYRYHCKTLYIPETMNLDQAIQSVNGLSMNELKKRARQLSATDEFIKEADMIDLKLYIVQYSISEDHIVTNEDINRIEQNDMTNRGLPDSKGDRVPNYIDLIPQFIVDDSLPDSSELKNPRILLSELSEDLE